MYGYSKCYYLSIKLILYSFKDPYICRDLFLLNGFNYSEEMELLIIYFFILIMGLFFGSFLNVIIDRLPRGESFISGRSHCESCGHTLSSRDLIPILSFVLLKGRCRYCRTSLSLQYLTLEVLTATTFLLTFVMLPGVSPFTLIYHFIIASILILIFFIDLKHGIIPFAIIIPGIVIVGVYLALTAIPSVILIHFVSALASALFFLLLFLGTKGRGMGFGDVVYAFFMGLVLGFPNIVLGLYIAFLTGAGISLILIILKRKRLKNSTIPFGPFLVLGTFVAILWGNTIINYFLGHII